MAIVEAASSRNRGPGCVTGNVMYPNEGSATRVAKQFEQTIYVCALCFQYHVTSQADAISTHQSSASAAGVGEGATNIRHPIVGSRIAMPGWEGRPVPFLCRR